MGDTNKPAFSELFEQTINYPDPDMRARYKLLIGLDDTKARLQKMIGLLVNPEGLQEWANKHHGGAKNVTDFVLRRPPLIVLAGDVGSGKSELALTVGDAVARSEKIDVELLPLSLSTRGDGRVGQMTQLISSAFDYTLEKAKKLKKSTGKSTGAVILLVDEADALAQSRENNQMHHEDKSGVNAFIRGIDSLGNGKYPAAVIMCTNRPGALDPAVQRRAAEIIIFGRPNDEARLNVLKDPLTELGFSGKSIDEIVKITGPQKNRAFGFTFSDLVQRLIPALVLDAYPDKAITAAAAINIAQAMLPTPPFKENTHGE